MFSAGFKNIYVRSLSSMCPLFPIALDLYSTNLSGNGEDILHEKPSPYPV